MNFDIRTTMTKTTLEFEIDNYVDTMTNTIISAIAEKVPTKSIKRNSIGLLIDTRGEFGKGQGYHRTRLTLIVYRNELARTLLSERETTGKRTATIWRENKERPMFLQAHFSSLLPEQSV